ncbi:uncharacterized protein [Bemisia tabaci]|uniref:uncharacterized protein n=1 Tax=Bemisia tabaci TaxID=7038 RepID=UPI0008F9C7D3|nr:PREDICTED: uncharacterized protein LOC109032536 [Bemisia tabaci]
MLCLSYFFLPSCILSAAVIINATRSHIPESLTDVEEEASREKTEDTNTLESLSAALGNSIEVSSDIPCHMDVQVTKRVTGHCVSLGHATRGCIAGSYLHPFHHECLGK